ncbi:60S ribosomal protein L28 [Salix suchowensis]|nr:60S ribosomal protein L28 [Salix suchowensis]
MSITKTFSLNSKAVKDDQVSAKRRRSDRCFSFKEVSIEPGKSLKHLDSNKFKIEIKRWAKAVVAYARQLFGTSDYFSFCDPLLSISRKENWKN